MTADVPPPLTLHTALTAWQAEPAVIAALVLLAGCYLSLTIRVRRRHPVRPWPARRTAGFLGGLLAVAVALQSSVATYDDTLFAAHMVQHLLLIMVAPPLLVFGRPITLLLHATGNPVHAAVKRVIRCGPVTVLTHPLVAAALYSATVAATHLTPFMNVVVDNGTVHVAEHVLYLVVGYLFFLPVVGAEPIRSRPSAAGRFLLVTLTMPVDTAVGVALMLAPHEMFSAYLRQGRTWGPAPLADLHAGGQIMWIGSDVVMTAFALALSLRFVRDPRHPGTLGTWVDGVRAAALRRGYADLGVAAAMPLTARNVDADEGHLDAYNSYLAELGRRHPRRGQRP